MVTEAEIHLEISNLTTCWNWIKISLKIKIDVLMMDMKLFFFAQESEAEYKRISVKLATSFTLCNRYILYWLLSVRLRREWYGSRRILVYLFVINFALYLSARKLPALSRTVLFTWFSRPWRLCQRGKFSCVSCCNDVIVNPGVRVFSYILVSTWIDRPCHSHQVGNFPGFVEGE